MIVYQTYYFLLIYFILYNVNKKLHFLFIKPREFVNLFKLVLACKCRKTSNCRERWIQLQRIILLYIKNE